MKPPDWTCSRARSICSSSRRSRDRSAARLRHRPPHRAGQRQRAAHQPGHDLRRRSCGSSNRVDRGRLGSSDNNRRAKFYSLTRSGRRQLQSETSYWRSLRRGRTGAPTAPGGDEMSALRRLWHRLRAVGSHQALDREFDAERDSHLRLAADDYERSGLDPAKRRGAGPSSHLAAATPRSSTSATPAACPGVEASARDFGYAWRGLRREPASTTIAVLILAIGIGANTAVFSLMRPVLLKPLPFEGAGSARLDRQHRPHGSERRHVPGRDIRSVARAVQVVQRLDGLLRVFRVRRTTH